MQAHDTAQAFDAHDPASPRLTRDDVVKIHIMHLSGEGWDRIAAEIGTTRKNVGRIVQGRRWRNMHPHIAPALYATPASEPAAQPLAESGAVADIVDSALRDARDRIIRELGGA